MPTTNRVPLIPEAWPAGHRAAMAVVVDLDPATQPWPVPSPFASAACAARLLGMFADLDIVPTVVADPGVEAPADLPATVAIDVATHARSAPDGVDGIQRRLGAMPNGVVSLAGPASQPAVSLNWVIDGTGAPWPLRDANSVIIPYSPWWHDISWFSPSNPSPPSALLETWSVSLASVRARGEVMTVIVSAPYAGQPGYLETIQRFLDETIGAGDVWIASATAIANHVRGDES